MEKSILTTLRKKAEHKALLKDGISYAKGPEEFIKQFITQWPRAGGGGGRETETTEGAGGRSAGMGQSCVIVLDCHDSYRNPHM